MENEPSILPKVLSTRNLILRLFCGIYLCAFLSFYIQSEGLFSPVDGITPTQIKDVRGKDIQEKLLSFIDRPSWLRILKQFDIPTFTGIEIISLLGIVFAFFGFVSKTFCVLPNFVILWTFYYSLVDIAGEFHQQSDDLLLEVGLVCILLAPGLSGDRYGVADNVMLILMRWVLFRFLFASGAVKLASGCPHWWNLSALKRHFETLPLPTNLAFYAFYLPEGFLKLTTIYVNLSELLCPWLFFAPVRSLRIFAFYWQLILQVCIIATGNYGFLNFMIIVMLLSLLDDSHFHSKSKDNEFSFKKIVSFILTLIAIVFIFVITTHFYEITFKNGKLDAKILIEKPQFMELLRQLIKLSPFIVTISLINSFLQSCISHPNIYGTKGFLNKLSKIIQLLAMSMIAIALVGCSTVPHGNLHRETNITTTKIGKAYDDVFHKYHIVHEWGLHLKKMRSERLELAFQYTYDDVKVESVKPRWRTYDVNYRPINKNHSLPYMGPFFSRLDFRFHKAVGQGAKFEKNFWLAGFTKQLLRNSRPALALLSQQNLLKVTKPPKFVRLTFVKVSYVPRADVELKNDGFWTRKILNENYIPPMSLTSNEFKDMMERVKVPVFKEKEGYPKLLEFLQQTRVVFQSADAHLVILGFIVASSLILFRIRRRSSN